MSNSGSPISISSLGRTPRRGQEGSSWTCGSGFHSYESIWASHAGLEAPELERESVPSCEPHKHTGGGITLYQAKVCTAEVSAWELLV